MWRNYFISLLSACCLTAVLPPAGAYAQGLRITGGNFAMTDNASLVIDQGGITNSGIFTPAKGTVLFTGGGAGAFISSSTPIAFHNLTINKTGSDVSLNSNISLDGTLQMVTGNLQLNNYNLDLGIGAGTIAGETNTAHVIGDIVIKAHLNNPVAVNPGNIGIEITSTKNLGLTEIHRSHTQQISSGGGKGIYRYYDITPSINTSLNATIKFYYLDDELGGINKSELVMFESSDTGKTWLNLGRNDSSTINGWVLKSSISKLSRFTLGSGTNGALPVTFLYFRGENKGSQNVLYWSTVDMLADHFDVQRSTDGLVFNTIGKITGNGNTAAAQDYTYVDANVAGSTYYYRVRSADNNNQFAYSRTIVLGVVNTATSVTVYPNPARDKVTIIYNSQVTGNIKASCYSMAGKLAGSQTVYVNRGINIITWNVSRYAAGIYTMVFEGDKKQTLAIVKQ